MKLRNKILSLVLIVLTLFSVVGCGAHGRETQPLYKYMLLYQIKSDKTNYAYGEEVVIEFLFSNGDYVFDKKDGDTYCVKIKESPYYEIVGEDMVYTEGFDIPIKGEYDYTYHYKVEFKIRITEEAMGAGTHAPNIVVNRVGDENWYDAILNSHMAEYSGDPEFPWGNIHPTAFGFTADEDGVEFSEYYSTYGKPTFLQRLFYPITKLINFLIDVFRNVILKQYSFSNSAFHTYPVSRI